MGTQKKSIDEIWKELNKKPVGGSAAVGGITMLPGITSSTRTVTHNLSESIKVPEVEEVAINGGGPKKTSHYDPTKAGVSAEDVNAYMARIQRLVNCLSDPDRGTRRQAATQLQTRLLQGDASAPAPDAALLQALVCGPLLYPLVNLMQDSIEKCRTVAVEVLTLAAKKVSDLSPVMPALMVELPKLMGHLPVVEPSEEVRLQLTELAAAIVNRKDRALMEPYISELCLLLCRALEDTFHEIKKAACSCTASLAAVVSADSLEPHAERLVSALLENLKHQHSRVRLACIEALDAVIGGGCMPAGTIESLVAPGVRAIVYDRAPAVREALFVALAHWLGHEGGGPSASEGRAGEEGDSSSTKPSPSRSDQTAVAAALLPLLLVGVTDDQPPVARTALGLVESVGDVWEAQTRSATPPESSESLASPMQVDESADADAQSTSYDHAKAAEELVLQLGEPFTGRPSSGARQISHMLMPRLLPPLLRELSEWTVALRSCAARQLHTLLILAEDAATPHLDKLLPALCSAIGDEEADVAARIIASVHAVGVHVEARRWMPLVLDHLSNAKLTISQKANSLVVVAGLLHSAGRANQPLPSDMLLLLASTLISEDIRGGCEHPAVRQQLLAVSGNALRWGQSRCLEVSRQLYTLLLQLYGFEKEPAKIKAVSAAMEELASACGVASFDDLAAEHAGTVYFKL
eukprot:gene21005-27864_t